ncbi:MAG: metal-sensitive transcriptional regulator, partial [Solibacillus sp.]
MNESTEETVACRKSHHPEHVKKNLTVRLNRIEGQIRGIKGMVEKDVYCDDIITQIS